MKARDIGTVELTDSKLLVSPPPPRARSTPPLRGTTWQQGREADLAATTARRKLQKDLGELNADRQGEGVASTQRVPWAPRNGRRSLRDATPHSEPGAAPHALGASQPGLVPHGGLRLALAVSDQSEESKPLSP